MTTVLICRVVMAIRKRRARSPGRLPDRAGDQQMAAAKLLLVGGDSNYECRLWSLIWIQMSGSVRQMSLDVRYGAEQELMIHHHY